jgi:hypothetical protein
LPDNFKWITKELPTREVTISSKPSGMDSVWLRKGIFSGSRTEFKTSVESQPTNDGIKTIKIAIVRAKALNYDSRIIQAALKTVDDVVPEKIQIEVTDQVKNDSPADWTIVLDENVHGVRGQSIVFRQTISDKLLVREKIDRWILTKRLNTDNAIEGQLTLLLAEILFPRTEDWRKASVNDVRTADEQILSKGEDSPDGKALAKVNTESIWILLLLITLVAERLVAYNRNQ